MFIIVKLDSSNFFRIILRGIKTFKNADLIPDEMENFEDYTTHGHEPGFVRLWKKNADIDRVVKQRKAPTIPTGHQVMSEEAQDFLFKVTNAHVISMGTISHNKSSCPYSHTYAG